MTDKEMLELAALASDMELFWKFSDVDRKSVPFTRKTNFYAGGLSEDRPWNPLTDDGDALRLAVNLEMVVGTYAHFSTVDYFALQKIESVIVYHIETNEDALAATRLAIVRASAEIGKAMLQKEKA